MAERYFDQRQKVVGILTELQAEADQVHSVIVGTGINVNQLAADFPEELQETATSLRLASGEKIDRAALVQTIMSTFEKGMKTISPTVLNRSSFCGKAML